MIQKYCLHFQEISQIKTSLVGGKAIHLGEMIHAGFTVPFGFCITTEAYNSFIAGNNLSSTIARLARDATLETISCNGHLIRNAFTQSTMPPDIETEIVDFIKKFGETKSYAIRSSATAEDLASASFAGQQDTYLNISGINNILTHTQKCWASLYTDRAILYRIKNNIPHHTVSMAVILQEMVIPDVSGIMFTADPVSGHRGIASIDASFGLGEALVSGIVSADMYKVNKSTLSIQHKTIAEKKLEIIPTNDCGTQTITIEKERSQKQALPDKHIKELTRIGNAIEHLYHCPQDIEWCIKNETIYILQSRAITTLLPLIEPAITDKSLHVFISFNHVQMMLQPISIMGISLLRMMLPFDTSATRDTDYTILKTAAGRLYIDFSRLLSFSIGRKIIPTFLQNVDALMAEALQEFLKRPGVSGQLHKSKTTLTSLRNFFIPAIGKIILNLFLRKPVGTVEWMNAYCVHRIHKSNTSIEQAKTPMEKVMVLKSILPFLHEFLIIIPKIGTGVASFKLLESLEPKLLGSRKYIDHIFQGLEGNITTNMGLLIGDLADAVRKSPQLIAEFENSAYETLLERIQNLPQEKEFKALFQSFIQKYGMRAAGEIDIRNKRWIEDPQPIAAAIMSIVKTSHHGIHRIEYTQKVDAAKKATQDFIREVRKKRGLIPALLIQRLIRVLRNYLPLREHPKYLLVNIMFLCKKTLLTCANELVGSGCISSEDDIFYLSIWETINLFKNKKNVQSIIEERKERYLHYKKLNPPRVLTSEGESITAGYKRHNLPAGSLVGIPASAGIIEGNAKVVTDPTLASVAKGEILIAPCTDPGWTPLFINASGLVMEIGGLLTHGTVVAREYGIPAVIGVSDATKIIKTGQKIRVNGTDGFVTLL